MRSQLYDYIEHSNCLILIDLIFVYIYICVDIRYYTNVLPQNEHSTDWYIKFSSPKQLENNSPCIKNLKRLSSKAEASQAEKSMLAKSFVNLGKSTRSSSGPSLANGITSPCRGGE